MHCQGLQLFIHTATCAPCSRSINLPADVNNVYGGTHAINPALKDFARRKSAAQRAFTALNKGNQPCKRNWDSTLTMVMKAIKIFMTLLGLACAVAPCYSRDELPASLPADVIRAGCSIFFSKDFHPIQDDPLSNPPFSIVNSWRCRDGENLPIDKYEINGSSPDVVTVFYWRRRDILVLVRWQVNSEAADYAGNYYELFAYTHSDKFGSPKFTRDNGIMKYFPPGFDGVDKNGVPVIYPFKDVPSIRKKLRSVYLN